MSIYFCNEFRARLFTSDRVKCQTTRPLHNFAQRFLGKFVVQLVSGQELRSLLTFKTRRSAKGSSSEESLCILKNIPHAIWFSLHLCAQVWADETIFRSKRRIEGSTSLHLEKLSGHWISIIISYVRPTQNNRFDHRHLSFTGSDRSSFQHKK